MAGFGLYLNGGLIVEGWGLRRAEDGGCGAGGGGGGHFPEGVRGREAVEDG